MLFYSKVHVAVVLIIWKRMCLQGRHSLLILYSSTNDLLLHYL